MLYTVQSKESQCSSSVIPILVTQNAFMTFRGKSQRCIEYYIVKFYMDTFTIFYLYFRINCLRKIITDLLFIKLIIFFYTILMNLLSYILKMIYLYN